MRWPAQVLHVARKDLRQHRWLILGYALYIGAAVALGFGGQLVGGPYFLLSAGLIFFASLLVASFVQADSPMEAAHWATLPLSGTAVLAAKFVVTAVVVILLPLIGQALLVLPFGGGTRGLGPMLVRSALWIGLPSLVFLGVASIVRGLASFSVAMLGLVIGTYLWAVAVAVSTFEVPALPGAVPLALCFALPAYAYATRNVRRSRAGAAIALLVLIPGSVRATGRVETTAAVPERWDGEVPVEIRPPVGFVPTPLAQLFGPNSDVRLPATIGAGSGGYLYQVVPRAAFLRDASGQSEPLNVVQEIFRRPPILPEAEGYTWLADLGSRVSTVVGRRSSDPSVRLGGSPTGAGFDVEVFVSRRSFTIEVPLREGEEIAAAGLSLRLTGVRDRTEQDLLELAFRSWGGQPFEILSNLRSWTFAERPMTFALLNPARREAVLLRMNGRRSYGSCCFILPGGGGSGGSLRLGLPATPSAEDYAELDESWLEAARLLVAIHEPAGSYRQRVEVSWSRTPWGGAGAVGPP